MTELPPFLRESRRFRDGFPLYRPEEFVTLKEAEVSMSFEALLATEDAAELLVDFLLLMPEEDNFDSEFHSILWLSNYTFISNIQDPFLIDGLEGRLDKVFELFVGHDDYNGTITFYRLSRAPQDNGATLINEVDTVLRLLAKHKTVSLIYVHPVEHPPRGPVPVSLEALRAFVSEAQSPRDLCFDAPLSSDHWRVITVSCNTNVKLHFGSRFNSTSDWQRGGAALIDAVSRNTCPTNIWLLKVEKAPQDSFRALVSALEANTSLSELTVSVSWEAREDNKHRTALFEAISRNRGLQRLSILFRDTSDSEWEALWLAVASQPTLKYIYLVSHQEQFKSQKRDDILLRSVRSNTVLCQLRCNRAVHDVQGVEEQVCRILELNRFRPLVQAIKQEPDACLRERLFAWTLLCDRVCQSPAFRFFLLKENPDLFSSFLSPTASTDRETVLGKCRR